MSAGRAQTIIECLAALPRGQKRGYTFRALDGEERFYSFEDLEREAQARAARLQALSLQKGDRLAIVVADPAHFVLTFLGAVCAGIVPVPIYPRASFKAKNSYMETVRHIIDAAGAKALITQEATVPALEELRSEQKVQHFIVLEKFLEGEARAFQAPDVNADDVCFFQFTSGSTSMPKGVVVSHRNLVDNARDFLGPHGCDRRPEDIGLTWLPLYHDMGLIGFVLATLVCDIPVYFIPTESFGRRPKMWLELISEKRATIVFAPNFGFALATKRAKDRDLEGLDLSCVRVAGCGAEPINPEVMKAFADRFAPAGFDESALLPCYGMAEATLAITFTPHGTGVKTDKVNTQALRNGHAEPATDGDESTELVCCGRAFPGTELRIVDEQGNSLPDRRVGEIVVRGPGVTAGYYQNPEVTAESFRAGALHTGDLGYLVDGDLYVCGRAKDLIIIRGANIYPQDIEWTVSEVPGVRRDNVVAFSVMRNGEEELVVAAEGNSSDAPALRESIARAVTEHHGLRVGHVAMVRVGSLPKTSSGKIQRRRAKRLFEDGELEEHPQ